MDDLDKRKLLSAVAHGSIFLSSTILSIGIPIILLLISEDYIVKENAKEAINLHINLYIYAFVCIILMFVVIGIPLLIILGLASFIMPIIALVNVINNTETPYRYPFIFRLV